MVVMGRLHTHGLKGGGHSPGPHCCFACSFASTVDVETGQILPDVEEAPAQLAPEVVAPDPRSPTLIVFSARAPPPVVS
jgi:hypothetical protein